jgi:hypothetical protein
MMADRISFTRSCSSSSLSASSNAPPAAAAAGAASSHSVGTLSLRGFLRGSRFLSANQLVHLTGYADFQVSHIEQLLVTDPEKKNHKDLLSASAPSSRPSAGMEVEDSVPSSTPLPFVFPSVSSSSSSFASSSSSAITVSKADEKLRESFLSLEPINSLSIEQSLITEQACSFLLLLCFAFCYPRSIFFSFS